MAAYSKAATPGKMVIDLFRIWAKAWAADTAEPVTSNTLGSLTTATFTQLKEQTADGCKITISSEFATVKEPMLGGTMKMDLEDQTAVIEATFVDADDALGAWIYPGSTLVAAVAGTSAAKLSVGGGSESPIHLVLEGVREDGKFVVVWIPKAYRTSNPERAFSRRGVAYTPAQWTAVIDGNETAGERLVKVFEEAAAS